MYFSPPQQQLNTCSSKMEERYFCERLRAFDSGMRMYALGIVAYLQSAFNRFDCIVIFGSVFEELWINYGHRFDHCYFFQKAASLSSYSLPLECSFVIFIRHKMDSWLRFCGVKCSERTINGFIGSEDFKYKIGPPSV